VRRAWRFSFEGGPLDGAEQMWPGEQPPLHFLVPMSPGPEALARLLDSSDMTRLELREAVYGQRYRLDGAVHYVFEEEREMKP